MQQSMFAKGNNSILKKINLFLFSICHYGIKINKCKSIPTDAAVFEN